MKSNEYEFAKLKPKERLGDAPVTADVHDKMIAMVKTLDQFLNDGARGQDRMWGFVILSFPFGGAEGQRCNFMSNGADRRDVVSLMKEMIARFEGQPEMQRRA